MAGEQQGQVERSLRALAHPLAVASLVLLALNDHVLKQAWPGFVTGKLSDVAGLVVAPLVLAVPLAVVGVRRPPLIAVLLTGAGFVAVKTTATGSALASDTWTAVAGTSYIRSDPTDLLALPALLVALRLHRLAGRARPRLRERALVTTGAVVLPFAVLATAATSPCDDGVRYRSLVVMQGTWEDGAGWDRGRRIVYGEELVLRPETGVADVRRLSEQEARRIDEDRVADRDRAACDPQRPKLCWRTYDRDGDAPDPTQVAFLAVQHSVDRGLTWTEETVLGSDEAEALREQAGEVCGEPLKLDLGVLAVASTEPGPVVAVSIANGGLAIRDASGTWTRYSDDDLEQRAGAAAPGEPEGRATRPRWERRHPIREVAVVEPIDPYDTPEPSPTPRPTPKPPCDDPVLVTVTPDPRNGPASTQPRCPPSSSP